MWWLFSRDIKCFEGRPRLIQWGELRPNATLVSGTPYSISPLSDVELSSKYGSVSFRLAITLYIRKGLLYSSHKCAKFRRRLLVYLILGQYLPQLKYTKISLISMS